MPCDRPAHTRPPPTPVPTHPAAAPARFNVSVDAGNYVSLRAFLGRLGDKLQERIVDDSGDGDLPSVEEFLERIAAQR